MPSFAALPPNDIWRRVTYIRSLSPEAVQNGANPASVTGNVGRGETLFFGKANCAACHEVNGRGSDLAADLSAIGARSTAAILAGMSHEPQPAGPRQVNKRWVDGTFTDGGAVRGYVLAEDSFSVVVRREDGTIVSIDRQAAKIADAKDAPVSPTNLRQTLSLSEHDEANNELTS